MKSSTRFFNLLTLSSSLLLTGCLANNSGHNYDDVVESLSKPKTPGPPQIPSPPYKKVCKSLSHPELEPKLLYQWTQSCETGVICWNQIMSSPTVGDLDGDGIPEIVFTTFPQQLHNINDQNLTLKIKKDDGTYALTNLDIPRLSPGVNRVYSNPVGDLKVLDGKTGKLKWSYGKLPTEWENAPHNTATPLLMDIDKDGKAEVFLPAYDYKSVLAFNHDGSLRWKLPTDFTNAFSGGFSGDDINSDGIGDILAGNLIVTEDKFTKQPRILFNDKIHSSTLLYSKNLNPNKPQEKYYLDQWGIYSTNDGEKIIDSSSLSLNRSAIADLFPNIPGNEIAVIDSGKDASRQGKTLIRILSIDWDNLKLNDVIPPIELISDEDKAYPYFNNLVAEKDELLNPGMDGNVKVVSIERNKVIFNKAIANNDRLTVNLQENDRIYFGTSPMVTRRAYFRSTAIEWSDLKNKMYSVSRTEGNQVILDRNVSDLVEVGDSIYLASKGPNGQGGHPNLGDYDGDGELEISVAGSHLYSVFNVDGSLLWSVPSTDYSSQKTGSTIFDFNGDGKAEILYADERTFRIFNGEDGETLYDIPNSSGTLIEYPLVADVNNDGSANIVLSANTYSSLEAEWAKAGPGIRVFESKGKNGWVPTRKIWNQYNYFIHNINDDLTTKTGTEGTPSLLTSFRQNTLSLFSPQEVCE